MDAPQGVVLGEEKALLRQGSARLVGDAATTACARRSRSAAELTPRVREALELMAEERSNRGIAEEPLVTPGAVQEHMPGVFAKLGVSEAPADHRRVRAVPAVPRR